MPSYWLWPNLLIYCCLVHLLLISDILSQAGVGNKTTQFCSCISTSWFPTWHIHGKASGFLIPRFQKVTCTQNTSKCVWWTCQWSNMEQICHTVPNLTGILKWSLWWQQHAKISFGFDWFKMPFPLDPLILIYIYRNQKFISKYLKTTWVLLVKLGFDLKPNTLSWLLTSIQGYSRPQMDIYKTSVGRYFHQTIKY